MLKTAPINFKNYTISAIDRTPYTYLIGWSKLNMWYYGAKYSKNCHPFHFFNESLSGRRNYKTSSKYVKSYIVKYGLPDVIQIRKVFNSIDSCICWESKVLTRLNARESKYLLNKTNGNNDWINRKPGATTTGRSAAKCAITGTKLGSISILDERWATGEIVGANTGYKHKQSSKDLQSIAKKGKSQLQEHINHRAKQNMGKTRSQDAIEATAAKNKGAHYQSQENKDAQSYRMKNRTKHKCDHCGIECDLMNFTKWHGQNCKRRNI